MSKRGSRLLIIDEYEPSRCVLALSFGRRDYTCRAVGTADEAVVCIETFDPNVVILEWAFRDGSGVGLASRLRARSIELGRSVIIIVAVSYADEPPGFLSGESIDEYLTKPVTVDEIENAFQRVRSTMPLRSK